MSASFSFPVRFLGRMRWPAMYLSLCGQRFFFIHSGSSETSSRERTRVRSVLAIVDNVQGRILLPVTIRVLSRLPTAKLKRLISFTQAPMVRGGYGQTA